MLSVKSWCVFYADGSTFSSEDGSWASAPAFGVQCVVYYHVDARKTVQVVGQDRAVYEYLGEGDYEGLKLGLWMDEQGFYRVLDAAGNSAP